MSNELIPGTRMATMKDSQRAYDRVIEITRRYGYTVGITGSTLFGDGVDIDLLVVASVDAKTSAGKVANAILFHLIREHLLQRILVFEELAEDGSSAAMSFVQRNRTVLDVYVIGLPEGVRK